MHIIRTFIPLFIFFTSCHAMEDKNTNSMDIVDSPPRIALHLSFSRLTEFDASTLEAPQAIHFLFLQNNQLTNNSFSRCSLLANLTTIILENNKLTQIPEEVCLLNNLTELMLSSNDIQHIPDTINNLKKLWALDLSYNPNIQPHLPKICGLHTLETLKLNYCNLTQLPDDLCNLTNLQRLYIHYHTLETLPERIGNLKKLKTINYFDFQHDFSVLPPSIRVTPYCRLIRTIDGNKPRMIYMRNRIKGYLLNKVPHLFKSGDLELIWTMLQQAVREQIPLEDLIVPLLLDENQRMLIFCNDAELLESLLKLAYRK